MAMSKLLESEIADKILELASRKYRAWLGRNNSGALRDSTGRIVRYGLGNVSSVGNKVFKSSDFIGVIPVCISQDMVGKKVGIFVAVETKRPDVSRDERYKAQENFVNFIKNQGGIAGIVSSPEEFDQLVREWFKR